MAGLACSGSVSGLTSVVLFPSFLIITYYLPPRCSTFPDALHKSLDLRISLPFRISAITGTNAWDTADSERNNHSEKEFVEEDDAERCSGSKLVVFSSD